MLCKIIVRIEGNIGLEKHKNSVSLQFNEQKVVFLWVLENFFRAKRETKSKPISIDTTSTSKTELDQLQVTNALQMSHNSKFNLKYTNR